LSQENAEKGETRQGSRRADLQKFLEMRALKKSKTPVFQRQESWRYVRIHDPWRKPKGVDSHMRLSVKGWPALVKIGYRGPKEARGLHPSGYRDVLVHNKSELEALSKDYDAARLAATVGKRKKIELAIRAKELGIRILNGRGLLPAQVRVPAEEEEEAKTEEKEEQAQETVIPQEAEEHKLEAVQTTESKQEVTSEEQAERPPVEATEKPEQEPAEKAKPKKVAKTKKKPQKKISSNKTSKPKPKKKQQSKKKKSKRSD
jgi:large subunit ribosomal protein L32e